MLPCFFLLSGRALPRPAKLQSDGAQVGHGKECIVNIEMRRLDAITPYAANAKRHDATQIANVAESIRQFGWTQPLVVDAAGVLVIGHCRFLAAQQMGLEEVPCVCMDDLTPEQVNALRLVDNKTNESPWDLDLLAEELPELDLSGFDFEWGALPELSPDLGSQEAHDSALAADLLSEDSPEYQAFVNKFASKKTSDDCYTPPNIYEVVKDWAVKQYGLEGRRILRPFYPGGDYKAVSYDDDSVVIDNPPFSIISEICRYYLENKIDFFLFAPALTLASIAGGDANYIGCGVTVTFENGANISISFATNMGDCVAMSAPDLLRQIDAANAENLRSMRAELPKYSYPAEVLTPAMLQYFSAHGVDFRVQRKHTAFIRALDAQKELGKTVFGAGFLLSEKAAAEKAAAEKAAAEKAAAEKSAATKWRLSERELAIVSSLGK